MSNLNTIKSAIKPINDQENQTATNMFNALLGLEPTRPTIALPLDISKEWPNTIDNIREFIQGFNQFLDDYNKKLDEIENTNENQTNEIQQMRQLLKENNYPFSSELIDKSNINVKVKELNGESNEQTIRQKYPEIFVKDSVKAKIRKLFESIRNIILNLNGIFIDYYEINKQQEKIGYKQLEFIAGTPCNIRENIEELPIPVSENDVKFIFTRHAFSCNNLTDATLVKKAKSFLVRKKGSDPSIVLYGMLQAYFKHKYDKNGSYNVEGEQRKDYYTLNKNERVYVSGLVRTWQTAVLLYLPNLKHNIPLELEVLPFLKEKHRSGGKSIDSGNFPGPIQDAIIKFKIFLEYLAVLSKDIRDLYIGRKINIYYLDLLVTFEIKKGGNSGINDNEKQKYRTNFGPIPDINYKIDFSNENDIIPTSYLPGNKQGKQKVNAANMNDKTLDYRPYVKVCLYNRDDKTQYNGKELSQIDIKKIQGKKFSESITKDDIFRIRDYEIHILNVFKRDFIEGKNMNDRNGHLTEFAHISHELQSRGGSFMTFHRDVNRPHKFRIDINNKYIYHDSLLSNYNQKNHEERKEMLDKYEENKNIPSFIEFFMMNYTYLNQHPNNETLIDQGNFDGRIVHSITHSQVMQEFLDSFFIKYYIPSNFPDENDIRKLDYMRTLRAEIKNHNVWDLVITYNAKKRKITSIEIRTGMSKPLIKGPASSYGLISGCEVLCKYNDKDKCDKKIVTKHHYSILPGNEKLVHSTITGTHRKNSRGGSIIKSRKTRKLNKKTKKTHRNKKRNNKRKTRYRKK